jgi:hypothetical protein
MKEAPVLANRGLLVDGNPTLRVRHFPLDETASAINPEPLELGDTSCPSGVGGRIARMHIDSQSGGDDSVEVCPLRINEKAPTKSRGCQYADLCSRARRAEARGAVRTPALR